MAGNIPPLVSSTPPPLNAFDDDEEEDEDEFGLYNTAEEIDYNECISFKEKDEGKQNGGKSRGEQDSTSQDSATDSGLCPDSEGMSPTPHSDEERTLKQNACDNFCLKTGKQPHNCDIQGTALANLETVLCPNLPNGHKEEDQESDDDFGNFVFAPSHRVRTDAEDGIEGNVLRIKPMPSKEQSSGEEYNDVDIVNYHPPIEQFTEKTEEVEAKQSKLNLVESSLNELDTNDCALEKEETCKNEQISSQFDESIEEVLDVASNNDSLSFTSADSSVGPKDTNGTSSESHRIELHGLVKEEEIVIEDHENSFKCTSGNLDYREEKRNTDENCDDEEFDDFTDFKTDFSDSSKSEQGDKHNEHSKTFVEQTKLEEATSLPPSHHEESDDEFSNFADFSSSECAFVSAQSSNSLENVSHIPLKLDDSDLRTESEFQDWVSVFPLEDSDTHLLVTPLLRQDDVVWSRLFPLESSPALSYQWNESLANRRLLSALNIDSRNILFTPWSTSAVPRFAANLSCGPLEPIKATEPLQPSVVPPSATVTTTISSTTTQEAVPDAHFDWVGSGLTNPLDGPKTVLNLPKTLSADAENILGMLPDISYMRKTYIIFPMNEA